MLNNQTIEILRALKLMGMASTYSDQLASPAAQSLVFDDRFGLLVDAERAHRDNSRVKRLLKRAKLKMSVACVEDIDFAQHRGLDKRMVLDLANCQWIARGQHVLITGLTGVGKTYLACALGTEAARKGYTVTYKRLPRLLEELEIAHADGSLPELRNKLARSKLLILDDWGVAPIDNRGRQDLLEVVDDRVPNASVLITSQMPVESWHEYLGEPTVADAILDRIVHSAHKISVTGESMRRAGARK
jgi:DNA replication protein DnaC